MKKWVRFFFLGFFSHGISKEGAKRGYSNVLLGLVLALGFIWAGFIGGDMLPFGAHYNNSPDFMATAHALLSNADIDKRIEVEIADGALKAKKHGGEYTDELLVNSFENDADKQNYSVNGYNVVVDMRPADTLAEVEAYCVYNDGSDVRISYEEYLSLNDVARLNFDFKLSYTGNALELTDELIEGYKTYLVGTGDENRNEVEKLADELAKNTITRAEYNRAIYELYFVSYYPEISSYESTSKVPLLRNYYYHKYISQGEKNYLLIFDDYMAGSLETKGKIAVSFYGFYDGIENGSLISGEESQKEADKLVDRFIKKAFNAVAPLNVYAYAMNIFSLIPFIALMPLVVTLLAYSISKLLGVESITSFGAMFKIIGSYVWFSALISSVLTVIMSFFVQRNLITALPLVLFFLALAVRSIIFAVKETELYNKSQQKETVITEA